MKGFFPLAAEGLLASPLREEVAEWRRYGEFVGVEAATRLLENGIRKPLQFADTHYKKLRTRRSFLLFGCAGSGKRSLVRAFCVHVGVNLIEIESLADVEASYERAHKEAPALVLVTRCTDALLDLSSPSAPLIGALERAAQTSQHRAVWTVVALDKPRTAIPPPLSSALLDGDAAAASTWMPPVSWASRTEDEPRDRFYARRLLLRKFIVERCPEAADCLDATNLHTLVVASHQTTPRQLAVFLDRVFVRPLDRLSTQQLADASRASLVPTWQDYEACLFSIGDEMPSIVPTLPEHVTTMPYEGLI